MWFYMSVIDNNDIYFKEICRYLCVEGGFLFINQFSSLLREIYYGGWMGMEDFN